MDKVRGRAVAARGAARSAGPEVPVAVSGWAMSSRLCRSALTPRKISTSPAAIISAAPTEKATTVSATLPVLTREENSSGPAIPPAPVPIA
jgi:hypothetical protein